MKTTLPNVFIDSLKGLPGFDSTAFLDSHKEDNQITSIRINPNKPFSISDSAISIEEKIPWASHGYYLTNRPSFTLDPLFHAGCYYVQEASSMLIQEALTQTCQLHEPLKVLDLCAAPGGKSTLLQSILSKESLLISNEVIKSRASILTENITKWGAMNVLVTNNDPKDFQRLPNYFDVIVVDAPCSGSGLFRKDPNAINEWSLDNVKLCSQRQERILADIMLSLKPGGILVYSTCSYSESENENIIDWLLSNYEMESIGLKLNANWNIIETMSPIKKGYGYRCYPDKVKGEGFFMSAFRKKESVHHQYKKGNTEKLQIIKNKDSIKNWTVLDDATGVFQWKDHLIAFPNLLLQEIPFLQKNLYIKKVGVNIGTIARDSIIPSHDLAMSTFYSNKIPFIELTLPQALDYLRLHTINIQSELLGWVIIQYKGLPLGFAKILPNRINNYYPKEWRIIHK